jgi:hydroxyacylglutathione hydrolase
MILLETLPVGDLQCNCSILGCPDTKEGIVVDPGGEPDRILEVVRHYDLRIRHVIHTHAHFDHIAATRDIKESTGGEAEIALHRADLFLYDGFTTQLAMLGWPASKFRSVLPVDHFLSDGETIIFGRKSADVIHTPGHTPGSCCFLVDANGPLLLSGDTLFARSIGRTDLPGGDYATIESSILNKLYTLAPETQVLPGHGPPTTIGEERRKNPFIRATV